MPTPPTSATPNFGSHPSLSTATPPWPPNGTTHTHPIHHTAPTPTGINYSLPIPPPPPLPPTSTP
eukprot:1570393-Alexandrium_andersonii.AAC.1